MLTVVSNMYYIPAGMMASLNQNYVEKAKEIYALTDEQIASLNFIHVIPSFVYVMIGNVIGGAIVVGGLCYLTQKKEWKSK